MHIKVSRSWGHNAIGALWILAKKQSLGLKLKTTVQNRGAVSMIREMSSSFFLPVTHISRPRKHKGTYTKIWDVNAAHMINSLDTVCIVCMFLLLLLCAGYSVWPAMSRGEIWTELFPGMSVSQQRLLCVIHWTMSLQPWIHRRTARANFTIYHKVYSSLYW